MHAFWHPPSPLCCVHTKSMAPKSDHTCNLCNSLIMGVTPSGAVTAVKKTGSGSFHSASVTEAMAAGAEVASEVHAALKEKLLQEERMGTGRKKHGFLK